MLRFGIIIFSLLFIYNVSASEESGNTVLDSLVEAALDNNPLIKAAKFRQQESVTKGKYAGWVPDPQFSVGFLNMPKNSLSLDETPMSGVQFGISQLIPWPGKLSAKSEIARLQAEQKQLSVQELENRIARLVSFSYYEYSYWEKSNSILSDYLDIIRNIIDVAQTKYANGIASIQDVLKTETARARLENRLIKVEQMQSLALAEIDKLTDNQQVKQSSFEASLSDIPGDDSIPEFNTSELSTPPIVKAALRTNLARKNVDLAKLSYRPNFMVGLDYRIRKEIPMDAVNGEDFLTFKVGFNLPLWFFKRQKNQTTAARYALNAAEYDKQAVINEIDNRIYDTRTALKSLISRVNQYENSILPQGKAAAEAAKVAYEVGKVDFNGYLAAQLTLLDIKLEQLELIKQFHQQKALLKELTSNVNEKV